MVSKSVFFTAALLLLASATGLTAATVTSGYVDVDNLSVYNMTGWPDFDVLYLEVAGVVHGENVGGTPYADVYALVQNACDYGLWDWGGISSTLAAGTPTVYGVGCMTGQDFTDIGNAVSPYNGTCGNNPEGSGNMMMNNPITTSRYAWGSLPASTELALLMNTYNGDIDFTGTVNSDDLTIVLANFNSGGGAGAGTWMDGDFDYDGLVTNADLTLTLANFASAGPGFVTSPAPVPEPGTIALLLTALGAGLFVYSRKRS